VVRSEPLISSHECAVAGSHGGQRLSARTLMPMRLLIAGMIAALLPVAAHAQSWNVPPQANRGLPLQVLELRHDERLRVAAPEFT